LTRLTQTPISSPDPSGTSNLDHPSILRKTAIEGNPGEVSFRAVFAPSSTARFAAGTNAVRVSLKLFGKK
jgi:hypothetical protein